MEGLYTVRNAILTPDTLGGCNRDVLLVVLTWGFVFPQVMVL